MASLLPEQKTLIVTEITTDPNSRGYQADITAGNTGYVVDKLNAPTEDANVSFWITDLTMMALLTKEMYVSIMNKLETIGPQDKATADFLARLHGTGADIGHPKTIESIEAIGALSSGGFTVEEVATLKLLSQRKVSFMQKNSLPVATIQLLYNEGIL